MCGVEVAALLALRQRQISKRAHAVLLRQRAQTVRERQQPAKEERDSGTKSITLLRLSSFWSSSKPPEPSNKERGDAFSPRANESASLASVARERSATGFGKRSLGASEENGKANAKHEAVLDRVWEAPPLCPPGDADAAAAARFDVLLQAHTHSRTHTRHTHATHFRRRCGGPSRTHWPAC
jgi:hypothetical protein